MRGIEETEVWEKGIGIACFLAMEATNSWWPSSKSWRRVSMSFSRGGQTFFLSTRVWPRMGPSQVWHIRRLEGADFVREGDGDSAIAGGIQYWVYWLLLSD